MRSFFLLWQGIRINSTSKYKAVCLEYSVVFFLLLGCNNKESVTILHQFLNTLPQPEAVKICKRIPPAGFVGIVIIREITYHRYVCLFDYVVLDSRHIYHRVHRHKPKLRVKVLDEFLKFRSFPLAQKPHHVSHQR